MAAFELSVSQVNFEEKDLEASDTLHSFSNLVSFDSDFKGKEESSAPIAARKLKRKKVNGKPSAESGVSQIVELIQTEGREHYLNSAFQENAPPYDIQQNSVQEIRSKLSNRGKHLLEACNVTPPGHAATRTKQFKNASISSSDGEVSRSSPQSPADSVQGDSFKAFTATTEALALQKSVIGSGSVTPATAQEIAEVVAATQKKLLKENIDNSYSSKETSKPDILLESKLSDESIETLTTHDGSGDALSSLDSEYEQNHKIETSLPNGKHSTDAGQELGYTGVGVQSPQYFHKSHSPLPSKELIRILPGDISTVIERKGWFSRGSSTDKGTNLKDNVDTGIVSNNSIAFEQVHEKEPEEQSDISSQQIAGRLNISEGYSYNHSMETSNVSDKKSTDLVINSYLSDHNVAGDPLTSSTPVKRKLSNSKMEEEGHTVTNHQELLQDNDNSSIKSDYADGRSSSVPASPLHVVNPTTMTATGSSNGEDTVSSYMYLTRELDKVMRERTKLEAQLEVVEAEARTTLRERARLQTKLSSVSQQLKVQDASTHGIKAERDGLVTSLEKARQKGSHMEQVVLDSHRLLEEKDVDIRTLQEDVRILQDASQQHQNEVQDLKQAILAKDATTQDLKTKITELYIDYQTTNQNKILAEGEMKSLQSDVRTLSTSKEWYQDQLQSAQAYKSGLQQEITKVKGEVITQSTMVERLKADNVRLKQKVTVAEQRALQEKERLVRHLEAIEAHMMEREVTFAQIQQQKDSIESSLQARLDTGKEDISQELKEDLQKAQHELRRRQAHIGVLEHEQAELTKRLTLSQESILERDKSLESQESKLIDLEVQLKKLYLEMQNKESEISELKDQKSALDSQLTSAFEEKKVFDGALGMLKSDMAKVEMSFKQMKSDLVQKQQELNTVKGEKDKINTQLAESNVQMVEFQKSVTTPKNSKVSICIQTETGSDIQHEDELAQVHSSMKIEVEEMKLKHSELVSYLELKNSTIAAELCKLKLNMECLKENNQQPSVVDKDLDDVSCNKILSLEEQVKETLAAKDELEVSLTSRIHQIERELSILQQENMDINGKCVDVSVNQQVGDTANTILIKDMINKLKAENMELQNSIASQQGTISSSLKEELGDNLVDLNDQELCLILDRLYRTNATLNQEIEEISSTEVQHPPHKFALQRYKTLCNDAQKCIMNVLLIHDSQAQLLDALGPDEPPHVVEQQVLLLLKVLGAEGVVFSDYKYGDVQKDLRESLNLLEEIKNKLYTGRSHVSEEDDFVQYRQKVNMILALRHKWQDKYSSENVINSLLNELSTQAKSLVTSTPPLVEDDVVAGDGEITEPLQSIETENDGLKQHQLHQKNELAAEHLKQQLFTVMEEKSKLEAKLATSSVDADTITMLSEQNSELRSRYGQLQTDSHKEVARLKAKLLQLGPQLADAVSGRRDGEVTLATERAQVQDQLSAGQQQYELLQQQLQQQQQINQHEVDERTSQMQTDIQLLHSELKKGVDDRLQVESALREAEASHSSQHSLMVALQQQLQEAKAALEAGQAREQETRALILDLEREKGRLAGVLQNHSALKEHTSSLEVALADREGSVAAFSSHIEEELERRDRQVEQLQEQLTDLQTTTTTHEQAAKDAKKQLLMEKASTVKSRRRIAALEEKMNKLQVDLETRTSELQTAVTGRDALQAAEKERQAKAETHAGELRGARLERDSLQRALDEREARDPIIEQQLKAFEWEVGEKKSEVAALQQQILLVEERQQLELNTLRGAQQTTHTELVGLREELSVVKHERGLLTAKAAELKAALQASVQHTKLVQSHSKDVAEVEAQPLPFDISALEKLLQDTKPTTVSSKPLSFLQATLSGLRGEITSLQDQVSQHTSTVYSSSLAWKELEAQVRDLREVCKTSAADREASQKMILEGMKLTSLDQATAPASIPLSKPS